MLDEIVGEAANLLEVMPPYAQVFITGGNLEKLLDMESEFDEYGITDVVFIRADQIFNGYLRGRCGHLLVVDTIYFPDDVLHCILQERHQLQWEYETYEPYWTGCSRGD